jgi:hypothetical protein
MGDPALFPGERVLMRTQGVSVKSTDYTLILTSNRLLLVDPGARSEAPPLQLLRAAILRAETAEDTGGRLAIRLATGTPRGVRSLLLVFASDKAGASERDAWLMALRGRTVSGGDKARESAGKRASSDLPSPQMFSGRMLLAIGIICLAVLIGIAAAFVSGIPDTDAPPLRTLPATAGPTPGSTIASPAGEVPLPDSTSPPSFSVSIDPVITSARPGDTVRYRMRINADEGFREPVHLELRVKALLFYAETYDLGTYAPPFPRTGEYPVIVPPHVPSGIRINGLLVATSPTQEQEQAITVLIQ